MEKQHLVKQGECLSSLAARYGLAGWEQIYNYGANADLKKKRPHPNILAPGDEVCVPEPQIQKVSMPTGKLHSFTMKEPQVKLRLAIADAKGKPLAGKRYALTVRSSEQTGQTTSEGLIEVDVSATEQSAQLRIWLDDDAADADFERELAIGHLDPVDLITGVQARLANLGFSCAVTGSIDDATLAAARTFRVRNGLPVDEPNESDSEAEPDNEEDDSAQEEYAARLIDDAFRDKLRELYEGK